MTAPDRPADADDPSALLAEMALVRGRVEEDAARTARAAGRATDWTVYVRAAPLACAAGAAVAGYLLVPARRRTTTKIVKVRGGKGTAAAPVEKPVSGRGPWTGALSVLGNVAVRAGTAYLSQKAGAAFGTAAAEPETAGGAGPRPGAFARNGRPAGPR